MTDVQLKILGFSGNIILLIGYLPQIIKILKTKKAEDISILTWICYFLGDLIALVYAILSNDIVFSTLFSFFTCGNLALIILTKKYGKIHKTPPAK